MRRSIIAIFLVSIIGLSVCVQPSFADTDYNAGALKHSEEELRQLVENSPQIAGIKYNVIGWERAKESESFSLLSEYTPAEFGAEFIMETDDDNMSLMNIVNPELPSSVDNSDYTAYQIANETEEECSYFPLIKNQGSNNSCVAWGMAYYQMSNNLAVVNNRIVRNGTTNVDENVMSPKWMYNLINAGANDGTDSVDAALIGMNLGCATWADCNGSNLNYTTWNQGEEIWENAIKNKIYLMTSFDVADEALPKTIEQVKSILCNGYVVSFDTDFQSKLKNWKYKDSESGESVCYYVEAADEGHCMTIVGYDDEIWVDVNGNDIVDEGESGAFKIANSWGTSWKDSGFTWLLYDAMYRETQISGVSNQDSRTAAAYQMVFVQPYKNYAPLIQANLTIDAKKRNQLKIQFGYSEINENAPKKWMEVYNRGTFASQVGYSAELPFSYSTKDSSKAYNFTGNISAANSYKSGQFVFDLTPIVNEASKSFDVNAGIKIYIKVIDNAPDDSYTCDLSGINIEEKPGYLNSTKEKPEYSNDAELSDVLSDDNSKVWVSEIQFHQDIIKDPQRIIAMFNNAILEESLNSETVAAKMGYDENNDVADTDVSVNYILEDDNPRILYVEFNDSLSNFINVSFNRGILTVGHNSFDEAEEISFYALRSEIEQ